MDVGSPEQPGKVLCERGSEELIARAEDQSDGHVEGCEPSRADRGVLAIERCEQASGPPADCRYRVCLMVIAEELRNHRRDADAGRVEWIEAKTLRSVLQEPEPLILVVEHRVREWCQRFVGEHPDQLGQMHGGCVA